MSNSDYTMININKVYFRLSDDQAYPTMLDYLVADNLVHLH